MSISYIYPPFSLRTSERLDKISDLITEELENMARVGDLDQIKSKRKAIIALLPYAAWRERAGDRRMADACLGVITDPSLGWSVGVQIVVLVSEAGPDFPNRLVTLLSPYAYWGFAPGPNTVTRWAEAALAVPYTEEVGQSVVDALLQIASNNPLRPYIPVDIWAWLKKQPTLPPACRGRRMGTEDPVVRGVRELGDIELLESYFLLVWSEWNSAPPRGFTEMRTSIREDLGGIGMERHREVLIKRLDHVLGQLDKGLGHLKEQIPWLGEYHIPEAREQYGELREVLLEVDREASEILTRTHFRLINLFNLLIPADVHRIPLDVHLCPPSPMFIVRPRLSLLVPPTLHFICFPLCHSFELRRLDPRRMRARGMAYRTCHRFRRYTILRTITYHFTPLFLNIPGHLTLRRIPHGSR